MENKVKKLSLRIDLAGIAGMDEEQKKPDFSQRAIAANIIKNVMNTYAQGRHGLSQADRKKFYNVFDTLDKAVADKQDEVELASEAVGFLRQCFREATLVPNEILRRAEALVDGMQGF